MDMAAFDDLLSAAPESPGVYIFRDAEGRPVYVGKAASLKSRLRSYSPSRATAAKEVFICGQAASLETMVTRSELEAFMLEQTLISRHRPRYNVIWRDNKSYPCLELTVADPYPRLHYTRRAPRKGSRYYGPYMAGVARRLQRLVNQYFRIPSCRAELDGRQQPCLYHHLDWCDAPCAGRITREAYAALVSQVRQFLKGGGAELVPRLEREMEEAAGREDFETAARLRDRMRAIRDALEDQAVIVPGSEDAEVLGLVRSGSFACLVLLSVIEGRVTGKQEFTVRRASDVSDGDLVSSFLGQHFSAMPPPPKLHLPCEIESRRLVEEWLAGRRGGSVEIATPKRGSGRDLLELAEANARASLVVRGRVGGEEAREQLAVVAEVLGLPRPPQRIEAVDLSHLHGEEAVGAVAVFREGLPSPREYRKYLIRTARGGDDYESMREVVRRRFKRLKEEGVSPPDLLLIDGGAGHLKAVEQVMREGEAEGTAVVALAKREEELFLPGREGAARLPEDSPALHLLQRARDEVHRYVNAYQRKRRAMALREAAGPLKARRRSRARSAAAGVTG